MSAAPIEKASSSDEWLADVVAGLAAYFATSLTVLLGVLFGANIVSRDTTPPDPVDACVRFDAGHYVDIIRNGYAYGPDKRSVVAFFPAYPLLARWVSFAVGLAPEEGALITANLFLVGAFIMLSRWARMRWPDATDDQRFLVLAVFGLWPMGLFFRMPYSERLFLFALLTFLYGMAKRWPLVVLALLAGFLTAIRPVGPAATAGLLWHILFQSGANRWTRIGQAVLLAPLACWGLLGFMLFQALTFGAPFAFVQTQENWRLGAPKDAGPHDKVVALATLEPIRGVYDPASYRFWAQLQPTASALFSVMFWNPIFFVLAAAILDVGRRMSWLTAPEVVVGLGLLIIPYQTRAYEMSMGSHGRFASLVVFNYLVVARAFALAGLAGRLALAVVLATFLCLFTSLYAGNHLFF